MQIFRRDTNEMLGFETTTILSFSILALLRPILNLCRPKSQENFQGFLGASQ